MTTSPGQWAVVTGGSMGIGRAIVERFVGAGANVVAVARGQEALDEAVATAQTMASPEQQVLGISADVASRPGVDALFDELVDRLPYLNIFVGNAGTGHVTPFLELSDDEFDSVLALNFTGTLRCCQLAGRMMVADPQPNSAIVVVSSIRALGARAGRLIYAATKAGVNQAVRVAARGAGAARHPGQRAVPGDHRDAADGEEPGGVRRGGGQRAAGPRRTADRPRRGGVLPVLPAASFITGVNLIVDGGESLSS